MKAISALLTFAGVLVIVTSAAAWFSTGDGARWWIPMMLDLGVHARWLLTPTAEHAQMGLGFGALLFVLGLATDSKRPTESTSHGSARWATTAEMRKFGYSEASVSWWTHLRVWLGLCWYPHYNGVVLCQEDSAVVKMKLVNRRVSLVSKREAPLVVVAEHHVAVEAPPGGGKDVSLFVPSILNEISRSIVVLDPKGLQYDETIGVNGRRGAVSMPVRFAPLEPGTAQFDVCGDVPVGKPGEIAAVNRITTLLLIGRKSDLDNSVFYASTAMPLMQSAIIYALNEFEGEYRGLAGAQKVLTDKTREQKEIILNLASWLRSRPHCEGLAGDLFVLSGNKTGIPQAFQTCRNALDFCSTPEVRAAISAIDPSRTFKPSQLSRGAVPVSLYLVIPFEDSKTLRPLTRLVIDLLFASHRFERTRDTCYYLNELPSVGPIPSIVEGAAQKRQYGVQIVFGYQSFSQVAKEYGPDDAAVIMDICQAKVSLRVAGYDAAKRVSERLGKTTIVQERETEAVSRKSAFESTVTKTKGEGHTARQLMSEDELFVMAPDKVIVMLPLVRPYMGVRTVSYSQPRWKKLVSTPLKKRAA